MTAIFPPTARYIFTILEPISLVAGFLGPVVSPQYFVASQAPAKAHPLYVTEHVIALQLGNTYLLLALLGVGILNTTTDPKVVRSYIWALWIADIGHVSITVWGMGISQAIDFLSWNLVTWGNIGATLFLFAARCLYLMGVFGPDRINIHKAMKKS